MQNYEKILSVVMIFLLIISSCIFTFSALANNMIIQEINEYDLYLQVAEKSEFIR